MFILLVPLRLLNPTCGADWNGENYGNAEFIHSVKQMEVKYHRLHPNYFYGVGSAQVIVRFIPSFRRYEGSVLTCIQHFMLFSYHTTAVILNDSHSHENYGTI
jgi:hypothetical protein